MQAPPRPAPTSQQLPFNTSFPSQGTQNQATIFNPQPSATPTFSKPPQVIAPPQPPPSPRTVQSQPPPSDSKLPSFPHQNLHSQPARQNDLSSSQLSAFPQFNQPSSLSSGTLHGQAPGPSQLFIPQAGSGLSTIPQFNFTPNPQASPQISLSGQQESRSQPLSDSESSPKSMPAQIFRPEANPTPSTFQSQSFSTLAEPDRPQTRTFSAAD